MEKTEKQLTVTITIDEFGDTVTVAYNPEPVAVRSSFDGHGWLYSDAGNGSDWLDRTKDYPDRQTLFDAESLFMLMKTNALAWAALPKVIRDQSPQSLIAGIRHLRSLHDDNVAYLSKVRATLGGIVALGRVAALREFIEEGLENAFDNGYIPDINDPLAEAGKMFEGDADVERLTMDLLAHFVKLEIRKLAEKHPELKQTKTQTQTPVPQTSESGDE